MEFVIIVSAVMCAMGIMTIIGVIVEILSDKSLR